MVVHKAAGTEVDDFDLALGVGLNQNILRLQIAMDQVQVMDEVQSIQDLLGDLLKSRNVEIMFLLHFPIVLGILVQVVPQELRDNKEMLFMVEVINHLQ